MPPRAIVRDPEILDGRWCLDGTMMPIGDIRRQLPSVDQQTLLRRYEAIGLTDEDLDAIDVFVFPAIREPSLTVHSQLATVHCPCGEATELPRTDEGITTGTCPCGRTWRVHATMELVEDPTKSPS